MKRSGSDGERPDVTDIRTRRSVAWGIPPLKFHRWPALLAILTDLALYVTLPRRLHYGPVWLLPTIEVALAVALLMAWQLEEEGHEWQRGVTISLIAAMYAGNVGSLLLLLHALLSRIAVNGHRINALNLIVWSAQVWLTNVIVFGLWYWELDRGGPIERTLPKHSAPDFLFPQMANPDSAPPNWTPSFFDYLYTSFTNAAAFSPTDTVPLSEWAKVLFMIQSSTSIMTMVLIVARIANILP